MWFSSIILIATGVSLSEAFFSPLYHFQWGYRGSANVILSAASTSKQTKELSGEDKLVYDLKQNRFYESDPSADTETEQIGEFCLVDPETGKNILLTKDEKERIFLDAIQSYYYSGKSNLNDVQFDQLRSDLSWEGSDLVTLNRDETLFVNAVAAYAKGTPIMTDKEFNKLKQTLKDSNSRIAVATHPKYYMDTGVCKVTWLPDKIRTSSLYVPATLVFSTLYLGISYELPFVRSLFNPLVLLLLGAFPIYKAVTKVTEQFLFKDPFVAGGPCPNCGTENRIFFGDVLGVEGDVDESTCKCTNCKKSLTVKRSTLRVSTLSSENTGVPPLANKGILGPMTA